MQPDAAVHPPSQPPPPRFRPLRRAIATLAWLYLAAVLLAWLLLRQATDYWWPATLASFGPRWLFALPLIPLAPAVLLLRRRSLPALAAAAFVVFVPLLNLRIPWRTWTAREQGAATLRVLTCNVDHHDLRARDLAALIADTRPDIVACQEWTSAHAPVLFADGGWHTIRHGELHLASRFPIRLAEVVSQSWTAPGTAARFEVDTPQGTVDFYNVHLASPHHPFDAALRRAPNTPDQVQANSDARLRQIQDLARSAAARPGPVVMAGDFNTPDDSPIFRQNLTPILQDAFATAGLGYGRTYHARWTQTRIDHVLASPALQPLTCSVAPNVGSAHRPVLAEFQVPTK